LTVSQQDHTDYQRVGEAIDFLVSGFREQPTLQQLADHLGLSPAHLQRIFTRWAGISPKKFLQLVTHTHARDLLANHASVLDTSFEVGLSGPGRLHDLFVSCEAMSPGEVKAQGAGLKLTFGFHPCPFGDALYVVSERGLAGIAFADDGPGSHEAALADMRGRWPLATFVEDPGASAGLAAALFGQEPEQDIPLLLIGTPFQVQVWKALLRIPLGQATTYADVAAHIGKPNAVRAVGTAIGRNPISFLIPCHRVLRGTGALGGYHWGLTRKRAILAWEGAQSEQLASSAA
jgi:AraC family transcriptional regulator of adaptative response/methylated-DNA-[protein]-cysteine methyltransferase